MTQYTLWDNRKIHLVDKYTKKTYCTNKNLLFGSSPTIVPAPAQYEFWCKKCLSSGLAQEVYDEWKAERIAYEEEHERKNKEWNTARAFLNDGAKKIIALFLNTIFVIPNEYISQIKGHPFGAEVEFKYPADEKFTVLITVTYDQRELRK